MIRTPRNAVIMEKTSNLDKLSFSRKKAMRAVQRGIVKNMQPAVETGMYFTDPHMP